MCTHIFIFFVIIYIYLFINYWLFVYLFIYMYQLAQGIMNGFLRRSWSITIPVKAVGSPPCNQTWKSSNHSLTSKSKWITSISGTSRNSPSRDMFQNDPKCGFHGGFLSQMISRSYQLRFPVAFVHPFSLRLTSISARRPWNSSQAS